MSAVTLDDLNDRITVLTIKYEAALNEFVAFCDKLHSNSLVPMFPFEEYERLGQAASRAEEDRDFAIVLYRIAEVEGMDRAMLWKLQHGGAQ